METPLLSRIVIVVAVVFLFSIFLKKTIKNENLGTKIRNQKIKVELFYPIIILCLCILLEYGYKLYKQTHSFAISHYLNDFDIFYYFRHCFYELLIIYLIFYLYYGFAIRDIHKQEKKEEFAFWDDYNKALLEAKSNIQALNTRDYNLFLSPLGSRYFFEQLKVLEFRNTKRNGNKKIVESIIKSSRIVVLDAKDLNDLKNSGEIFGLRSKDRLCTYQRNFNAMYEIHKLHNINLYIAPKKEIKEDIKTAYPGVKNLFKRKMTYEKLDRLMIDTTCYCPDEENNKLIFSKDPEMEPFVSKIIKKYKNDTYNVKKIITRKPTRDFA